jgi:hypothetical protein
VVPDLVVALSFVKRCRLEGNQIAERVYVIALLRDYSTGGISQGIDFNSYRMIWAPDSQNRFGNEGGFEHFKSGLLSEAPYKEHILLGEVVKQPVYLEKVLDKASVEIGKPNETSDFFEFHGWGPIFDSDVETGLDTTQESSRGFLTTRWQAA